MSGLITMSRVGLQRPHHVTEKRNGHGWKSPQSRFRIRWSFTLCQLYPESKVDQLQYWLDRKKLVGPRASLYAKIRKSGEASEMLGSVEATNTASRTTRLETLASSPWGPQSWHGMPCLSKCVFSLTVVKHRLFKCCKSRYVDKSTDLSKLS